MSDWHKTLCKHNFFQGLRQGVSTINVPCAHPDASPSLLQSNGGVRVQAKLRCGSHIAAMK